MYLPPLKSFFCKERSFEKDRMFKLRRLERSSCFFQSRAVVCSQFLAMVFNKEIKPGTGLVPKHPLPHPGPSILFSASHVLQSNTFNLIFFNACNPKRSFSIQNNLIISCKTYISFSFRTFGVVSPFWRVKELAQSLTQKLRLGL